MELEITKRQGLIVYLHHLRQSRQLKKYGDVYYISRRMKYVVLYVDQADAPALVEKISKLRFVKGVSLSECENLATEFDHALGKYKLTDEDREKFKLKNKAENNS